MPFGESDLKASIVVNMISFALWNKPESLLILYFVIENNPNP